MKLNGETFIVLPESWGTNTFLPEASFANTNAHSCQKSTHKTHMAPFYIQPCNPFWDVLSHCRLCRITEICKTDCQEHKVTKVTRLGWFAPFKLLLFGGNLHAFHLGPKTRLIFFGNILLSFRLTCQPDARWRHCTIRLHGTLRRVRPFAPGAKKELDSTWLQRTTCCSLSLSPSLY